MRPPVRFVLSVSCRAVLLTRKELGSLIRESSSVASYLSAAKSHCMPLKSGLEKVIGVSVVRNSLPTAIE